MNSGITTHINKHRGTIALVANQAWSVYNFRMPVIRALQADGYRVVVIVPVDESVSVLLKEPGIELVVLRHFRRNSTNIWASIKMIVEFRKVYKALHPDAVIHFGVQANIFGNFAARLAKIPSVCVVTGLGYTFLHKGMVPWLTRWLYRITFLKTAKVVFENQADLDLMVFSKMVERSITYHVPGCGIDTQYFTASTTAASLHPPVFTLIGRLLYDKGIREFAAAAARLKAAYPAAECWLLGHLDNENPAHVHKEELIQWVQSGHIHYKGATKDVRPIIEQSDWIVLPSYREGLSRVLLEAMSMARPIITTDTPGCRETVVPGKNGFLVPVKDENLLFEAMLKACTISPEQRYAMGKFGREKAEKEYSANIVGQHFKKIINTITDSTRKERIRDTR